MVEKIKKKSSRSKKEYSTKPRSKKNFPATFKVADLLKVVKKKNFNPSIDQKLLDFNDFSIDYVCYDQALVFSGVFRLSKLERAGEFVSTLFMVYEKLNGVMILDFKKLKYINTMSCLSLGWFFENIFSNKKKKKTKIEIVISSLLNSNAMLLKSLVDLYPDLIEYNIYDENFYEGQRLLENEKIVTILRNQTKILWPQERPHLKEHGLKDGMKVADICCGSGDFLIHVAKEFNLSYACGVDHSKVSVVHARKICKNLDLKNVEFMVGDATSLLFEDNSFDFVSCRLSFQVFPNPHLIMKEMFRVLKPGGRIYVVNEDYGMIVSSHHSSSVAKLYALLQNRVEKNMNMDFYIGRRVCEFLNNFKFKDMKVSTIDVNTANSQKEDYIKVVQGWKDFYVHPSNKKELFNNRKTEYNMVDRLFLDHMNAIEHPHSYTCWPLIAGSGTKAV